MTRTVLAASTAIIALLGSNAAPAQRSPVVALTAATAQPPLVNPAARTLYTQNSNSAGEALLSECFTSGSYTECSGTGADDFVVPSGKAWKIGEVDVTGVYFNGTGPATSVNVIFWKNNNGKPAKVIRIYKDISCGDSSGSFSCTLPSKIGLRAGHYWVSVEANMNFSSGGEWGWEMSSVVHNDSAVESCGAACWEKLGYDLMFDLKT